jgi:multiple sugar transport system substrate-binding protein
MSDREQRPSLDDVRIRRLSRRGVLRLGLAAMATLPLAAACGGQQQAAPAAPAKPTEAPKPTAAAAKPTEAAKPAADAKPTAAPAATSAPAAAAKPTEAAKPTAAGAIAEPKAPAFNKARINGKLTVIQALDFHPDHNKLVENKIREFAEKMEYPLDHSYISAFAGTGNPVQKLVASVQAGDAPDLFCHSGIQPAEMKELDALEDVDSVMKSIISEYGEPAKTYQVQSVLDGKWWSVPHFSRAGGWWVVDKYFEGTGIDPKKGFATFDELRDAAMKASKPQQEIWGWGITANRSGDGVTTVRQPIFAWGGQLTDETGQVVVLNKEPYRTHTIAALTWLKETYTDPKWAAMLPPGVQSWTDPSNNEAYLAGKLAISNNGGTMYAKAVVDGNPIADNTYLIQNPKGMGPAARVLQGPGDPMRWMVMKGAKNREAAEQLIRYLLSPDVQREMWKISPGYVYPAYQWGWDDPIIRENKYAQKVTEQYRTVFNDPSGFLNGNWPGPPTAWVASLESSNFWTDMFGEILNGKAVDVAVKDAHDKAVRVFREFGAKGE